MYKDLFTQCDKNSMFYTSATGFYFVIQGFCIKKKKKS